jgi:hypothetical protein
LVLQIGILNSSWIFSSRTLSMGIIPSYLDEQSPESYPKPLDVAEYFNTLLQKVYRLRIHNLLGFAIHFPAN